MLHQIENDLKEALKSQDKAKLGVLRILISKCRNKSIATGKPLEDSEVMKVLQTAAKQHKESIKLYNQGGRNDLVEKETLELNIVEAYLPSMMTEDEIRLIVVSVIEKTGAASMAAISSDGVVTLSDNTTSTSIATGALKVTGGVGIAENLNVGGTLNVTGAATAETPPASSNSTRIATTAFVAAGTAGTVTSISDHIQSSSNNTNAATSGSEYSATASIASGSRTFDRSSTTNTFNAGIDIGSNSIVTITFTQGASVFSGGLIHNIQKLRIQVSCAK